MVWLSSAFNVALIELIAGVWSNISNIIVVINGDETTKKEINNETRGIKTPQKNLK